MDKLEQTADECLKAIGESCTRLLFALHESPEAVWGELMRMESAGHAFQEVCSGLQDPPAEVCEIMSFVEALRVQMAKEGLLGYKEFAAFRQGVSAIQRWADRVRHWFGEKAASSHRRLVLYVFYCANHLDAVRLADLGEEVGGDTVKTIGLPCSGKVDVPYLVKALETGADGVAIVACKKKECRHFEGSLRAHKRAEAVESLLEEIGLGAGRMAVMECAKDGAERVCDEIKQFIGRVRSLPQGRTPSDELKKQERKAA
jgi:F420-non-reducing hydrogenase iron-sulfur subunit